MRISDWSSDVCSSDRLGRAADAEPGDAGQRRVFGQPPAHGGQAVDEGGAVLGSHGTHRLPPLPWPPPASSSACSQPGSALAQAVMLLAPRQTTRSDRKRVVKGKWVEVRVDLAGSRIIKK